MLVDATRDLEDGLHIAPFGTKAHPFQSGRAKPRVSVALSMASRVWSLEDVR